MNTERFHGYSIWKHASGAFMITKGRCFPEAFICFQEKSEHLPGAHLNHICSSLLQQNLTMTMKENAQRVTQHNSRIHTAFHWHAYNPLICESRHRCLPIIVRIASCVWWINDLTITTVLIGILELLKKSEYFTWKACWRKMLLLPC